MSAAHERHLLRGALAGIAGGLIASWMMNEFMAGPGKKLEESVQEYEPAQKQQKNTEEDDSTMKAADAIVEITTGGRHLSYEGMKKGGPIVHYAFGALMGGLYGCLAEYSKTSRAGLGTIFGSLLFLAGDLIAVPAFHLSEPPMEQPASALIKPFAAHLVYGSTTELVRRTLRAVS
jgi:putative membrane protein